MVSGGAWKREGSFDPDNHRRAKLAEIEAEIERLEARLAPSARRGASDEDIARLAAKVGALAGRVTSAPPAAAPGASPRQDARLDALASAVRDIEERTALLAASAGRRPDPLPRRTAAIDRPSPASPEDPSFRGFDRVLRELRAKVENLRPSAARPLGLSAQASVDREATEQRLRAAIAEISARQEAIDHANAGRGGSPSPSRPERRTATSAARRDVDLGNEIGRLGEQLSEILRREESGAGALSRIDERLSAFLRDRSAAGDQLGAIADELSRIREGIDGSAREATLASIESGYAHIVERLDRLARERADVPSPGIADDLAAITSRLDMLGATLPERERLNDLAVGVAQLGRAVAAREGSGDLSGLEQRLEQIAADLGKLQSWAESSSTESAAAIERSLLAIAEHIDQAVARVPAAARFDAVLERLSAIADRLDAPRDDATESALDSLRGEVALLRSTLSSNGRPEAEVLENQLRALMIRIDALPAQNDAALGQLERQIAQLADRLDDMGAAPRSHARVDAELERLEAILRDTRDSSLEAAREAARAAVSEYSGGGDETDAAIRSLKDELRRLQSVAERSDNRAQDTLDTVHGALEKVSARLMALEGRPAPADRAGRDVEAPSTAHARGEGPGAGIEPPARPIPRAGDRKADFIAAARRAAQAAAAESTSEAPSSGAEQAGPLGRIGRALLGRKRSVLLAAAAIVLTIAAIRLFAGDAQTEQAHLLPSEPARVAAAPAALAAAAERPPSGGSAAAKAAIAETRPGPDPGALPPPADPAPREVGSDAAFAPPTSVTSRFAPATDGPPADGFAPLPAPAIGTRDTDPAITTAAISPASVPEPSIGTPALRRAATAGDPAALFEIASRYAEGRDTAQNLKLAFDWFRRAAEGGLPVAEFRVAALYERGEGTAKDRKIAKQWYAKAAEHGNVRAMHNLAVMVSEGVDGGPDYGAAADWFQRAADFGVKDSQYNLGVIFARGLGRKQDLVQSYKWFAAAAAQGDVDAAGRRDEVAKTLTPDQLAQARAAVQVWRATTPSEAANAEPARDPSWAAAPDKRSVLDREALVRKVQALLAEQGFDPGPADGRAGAKTTAAVKAFQARIGAKATGEIDAGLIAALDAG